MTALGVVSTEVVANLRASKVRTMVLVLAAFFCAFGSIWYSGHETGHLQNSWDRQVAAGLYTYNVTPQYGSGVPSVLCDEANSVSGVIGAGGIIDRLDVVPATAPDTTVGMLLVTPGFPAATWTKVSDYAGARAYAPVAFARAEGTVPGSNFVFRYESEQRWQSVPVDSVVSNRNRVDGVNDALMVIRAANTGAVQTCVVSLEPADSSVTLTAIRGVFGAGYSVQPLLGPGAGSTPQGQLMQARTGNWLAVAAGLILLALQLSSWLGSRKDYALYRALGLANRDVRRMLVQECLLKQLLPASAGVLAALVSLSPTSAAVIEIIGLNYGALLLTIALTPALGAALLLRVSAINVLRGQ